MLEIDHHAQTPLVAQIIRRVSALVQNGDWIPGTRLPSIRRLAAQCEVSPLTVSNAYNRLVADGVLEARRASGFFVARQAEQRNEAAAVPADIATSIDSSWMLQRAYENNASVIQAGCGWLPDSYLFLDGIRHAFTALARRPDPAMSGYGNPYGNPGLREMVRLLLLRQGIKCDLSALILTHGASQALELSVRCLTQPGDTVLVEDPGYCNLFPALEVLGLRVIGIPRLHDGPCLKTLEQVAHTKRPKAFVLNTRLHNPTGTSCTPSVTHHVLSLAERHDFMIIEDDIFGGLADEAIPTLAHLDQLQRVIFISSFSKTISPGLRVGFLACPADISARILRLKMASSLTSSSMNEAVVHTILADGRYRLHLRKLRDKLAVARKNVESSLRTAGLEIFTRPEGGMFLWARFQNRVNPVEVSRKAAEQNIMLAPGFLFSPDQTPTPWLRFNASQMDNPRLFSFLSNAIPNPRS
ncbi:PLP-dependent aminotransferase family protein [Gluconobacter wancherniae]|uniref:aminotransferase-like domain-containing protein n=1 Tax=Gluconobacter wancherniae TaxID=1307955 RepID=UPI001B8BFF2E|nr:PLP-dependent aminotransferase family protein [Gluconobacter wancherniae]MBS1062192.1 PLP-dependent aminotransferase family protein [Gluconobacter wancherniae]